MALLGAVMLAGCGEGDSSSSGADKERIARGKKVYMKVCITCHGLKGQGVENQGKAFIGDPFILEQADDEILKLVISGRLPSDPDNTTGLEMQPRGGDQSLTDEQLLDAIAYIRTLAKAGG
jgi:mono/diheme cytochrome c family protein